LAKRAWLINSYILQLACFLRQTILGERSMQTMADRDGVIWMDGELVPWREAKVHVLTHTLHYGMGVFEGVRAYNAEQGTAIFRLQAHTDRLFDSAHIMNMPISFDKETINEAQRTVVRENNLESAYIRPMCFYGSEGMGLRADNLKTHVMVAAWEWGAYLGEENLTKGLRIRTSSYTRHHVNISMCKAKANGHYINSMLALQEALTDGYDEAMLLDNEGYVAEGSGENIFLVKEGVIYTPDLTSALNGITRNTIFTMCKELGIEIKEKRITRDEVYIADEAFFTGTAAEVTPIREVDNRTIGCGSRGPVTEKLQTMYFDVVHGRKDLHPEWLTLVSD
jgi:branched-chain amino acid aminotransferase